jgi:CSLREA domain-containing protein
MAMLLIAPGVAQAATITVNTNADTSMGQCTLRDAIGAANSNGATGACPAGIGADVINFNVPAGSTITLGSALPIIASDLDIQGPGAGQLTVSGNDAVRVFDVDSGHTDSITGLTIADGRCGSSCSNGAVGGGIQNRGTLTLDGVVLTQNTAISSSGGLPAGGGIFNQGTLTLTLSTVSSNTVSATGGTSQNGPAGGGIWNGGSASLTIDRSTLSDNDATAVAGAGGTTNARGAGIANFGTLTVERSTLSANTASATGSSTDNAAAGGAVVNANAPSVKVTFDRSTISGNAVSAGAPASAQGGGIYAGVSPPATVAVTSSTLTGNIAAFYANAFVSSQVTFKNAIISNPQGGGTNCSGAATSQGFNLTDGTGCGFTQPTDQQSTNPMLDPVGLADNGGPTQTIALAPASPAVDQGLSSGGETVDQRGLSRPSDFGVIPNAGGGDGTDIGAFELQDATPPDTTITSGPADGSLTNQTTATFAFASSEPGSSFECSVDGGAFIACPNPETTSPLADGPHAFAVRAVDAAHNPDPAPATRTLTVDSTSPQTKIKGLRAKTDKRKLKIKFASSEAGSMFRCKLDRKPLKRCTSPYKTKKLSFGIHRFRVVATDPAGNADPTPAKAKFEVMPS